MTARSFPSTRQKPLTTGDTGPTDVPAMPRVRITRKFAQFIDGIDLSRVKAGDMLDLSEKEVRVLLAEGWAERDGEAQGPVKKARPRRLKQPLQFIPGARIHFSR